jgi:hypothetical protein
MKCRADIQTLADEKLSEAESLLREGFADGAYYIAGYTVELLLKAMICKTLGVDNFFDFDKVPKKELYRPFKVHNYEELFYLSGIYTPFSDAKKYDSTFLKAWSTASPWTEESRYLTGKTPHDVIDFITSVKEIAIWIKKFL